MGGRVEVGELEVCGCEGLELRLSVWGVRFEGFGFRVRAEASGFRLVA